VDNVDGFFQGCWHGVSIPHFLPPKREQLRACVPVAKFNALC
jgi:hypothetical protein